MADENGDGVEDKPSASGTGRALQRTPPIIDAQAEEANGKPENKTLPPFEDPELQSKKRTHRSLWPVFFAILGGASIALLGEWALITFEQPNSVSVEISKDLQGVKARLAELQHGAEHAGETTRHDLSSLEERFAAVENTLEGHTRALNQMQEAQRAAGTSPTSPQSEAAAETSADQSNAIAANHQQIEAIDQRVGTIEETVTGLREEMQKGQQEMTAALQAHDPQAYDERLNLLEQQIGTLQKTLAQAKIDIRFLRDTQSDAADNRRNRLETTAILASALVEKIRRGGLSYNEDLDALETLGVDKGRLNALRAAANTGVATPRALRDEFAALSKGLVVTSPPAKSDEGFLERLERDASQLVRVTRLDGKDSKESGNIVAAVTIALARGEVDEAMTLLNDLPPDARVKASTFTAALQTRIDALREARAVEAEAVSTLGRQKY